MPAWHSPTPASKRLRPLAPLRLDHGHDIVIGVKRAVADDLVDTPDDKIESHAEVLSVRYARRLDSAADHVNRTDQVAPKKPFVGIV